MSATGAKQLWLYMPELFESDVVDAQASASGLGPAWSELREPWATAGVQKSELDGISAFGLSNQLGIEQGEAGAYIKTYFERFPGIRDYMDAMRAQVRERAFVTTIFGRRINIPDARAKSVGQRQFAERAAINAPIQGAAADIIRRAMIRMPAALEAAGLKTRMLLQVHDELVFEAPQAEAEPACAVIRQVMEGAAEPAIALSAPLVVEARAAANWDEAH